jgi:Amt family ammonium transporter
MLRRVFFLVSFLSFATIPTFALSPASEPATQAQVAALDQAVRSAQSAGDNAWVLVSAALVLLMTAPGLTLFYGGLVRRKNILGTMMQSFAMMGLITILWAVVGYSLAFGAGNSLIGGASCKIPQPPVSASTFEAF